MTTETEPDIKPPSLSRVFGFGAAGVLGTALLPLMLRSLPPAPLSKEVVAVLPLSGEDARDGNDALRSILLAAVEPAPSGNTPAKLRLLSINVNHFAGRNGDLDERIEELVALVARESRSETRNVIAHAYTHQVARLREHLTSGVQRFYTPSATSMELKSGTPTSRSIEMICPDNQVLARSIYHAISELEPIDERTERCLHVISDEDESTPYVRDLSGYIFEAVRKDGVFRPLGDNFAMDGKLSDLCKCEAGVFIGQAQKFERFLRGAARRLPEVGHSCHFTLVASEAGDAKDIRNEPTKRAIERLNDAGWTLLMTSLYSQSTREGEKYQDFVRTYKSQFAAEPSPPGYWVYQSSLAAFEVRGADQHEEDYVEIVPFTVEPS